MAHAKTSETLILMMARQKGSQSSCHHAMAECRGFGRSFLAVAARLAKAFSVALVGCSSLLSTTFSTRSVKVLISSRIIPFFWNWTGRACIGRWRCIGGCWPQRTAGVGSSSFNELSAVSTKLLSKKGVEGPREVLLEGLSVEEDMEWMEVFRRSGKGKTKRGDASVIMGVREAGGGGKVKLLVTWLRIATCNGVVVSE